MKKDAGHAHGDGYKNYKHRYGVGMLKLAGTFRHTISMAIKTKDTSNFKSPEPSFFIITNIYFGKYILLTTDLFLRTIPTPASTDLLKKFPHCQADHHKSGEIILAGAKHDPDDKHVDKHKKQWFKYPPQPVKIGTGKFRFEAPPGRNTGCTTSTALNHGKISSGPPSKLYEVDD